MLPPRRQMKLEPIGKLLVIGVDMNHTLRAQPLSETFDLGQQVPLAAMEDHDSRRDHATQLCQ